MEAQYKMQTLIKKIENQVSVGFMIGALLTVGAGKYAIEGSSNILEYSHQSSMLEQQSTNIKFVNLHSRLQAAKEQVSKVDGENLIRAAATVDIIKPEFPIAPRAARGYGHFKLSEEESERLVNYVRLSDEEADFKEKYKSEIESLQNSENALDRRYTNFDTLGKWALGFYGLGAGIKIMRNNRRKK
jgi:hypothetical protein